MKKILCMILCVLTLLSAIPALASDGIQVYVNGVRVEFDTEPEIINGRIFVPLRGISEALDIAPSWDSEAGSVSINYNGCLTTITIGSTTATRREEGAVTSAELEAAPYIKDGRTMVPLRFVAETLRMEVNWDEATRTATITSRVSVQSGETTPAAEEDFSLFEECVYQYINYSLPQYLSDSGIAETIKGSIDSFSLVTFNAWIGTVGAVTLTELEKTDPNESASIASMLSNGDIDGYMKAIAAQAHSLDIDTTFPYSYLDAVEYADGSIAYIVNADENWEYADVPGLSSCFVVISNGKRACLYFLENLSNGSKVLSSIFIYENMWIYRTVEYISSGSLPLTNYEIADMSYEDFESRMF